MPGRRTSLTKQHSITSWIAISFGNAYATLCRPARELFCVYYSLLLSDLALYCGDKNRRVIKKGNSSRPIRFAIKHLVHAAFRDRAASLASGGCRIAALWRDRRQGRDHVTDNEQDAGSISPDDAE